MIIVVCSKQILYIINDFGFCNVGGGVVRLCWTQLEEEEQLKFMGTGFNRKLYKTYVESY